MGAACRQSTRYRLPAYSAIQSDHLSLVYLYVYSDYLFLQTLRRHAAAPAARIGGRVGLRGLLSAP